VRSIVVAMKSGSELNVARGADVDLPPHAADEYSFCDGFIKTTGPRSELGQRRQADQGELGMKLKYSWRYSRHQGAAGYRVPAARRAAAGLLVAAAALAAGCSAIGLSSDKIDYRSGEPQKTKPLDVPPDLTPLPANDRYALPNVASAAQTPARGDAGSAAAGAPLAASVAPSLPNAHVERAGSQRYLAVDVAPEQAYKVVKEFWPSVGLAIERDDPAAGIVETAWAENRAKLPQDIIRRTIGRVIDALYSTGEQDRFRTRVERTDNNTSEIYISHRGMVEVYTSTDKDRTMWQPRPADPELEAEMLQRLLLRFAPAAAPVTTTAAAGAAAAPAAAAAVGTAATTTTAAGANKEPPRNVHFVKNAAGRTEKLEISEPFDRAWRRIGLGLDRGGFTVEDRDRAKGIYFVRFLDPEYDAKQREKQGLFGRIFGLDYKVDPPRFRVLVATISDHSEVTVLDKDGAPETGPTGDKILALLSEQLR